MLPPYRGLGDGGTFLAQSFNLEWTAPASPELSGQVEVEYSTDTLCWCRWLSGSICITKYGSTKPESG